MLQILSLSAVTPSPPPHHLPDLSGSAFPFYLLNMGGTYHQSLCLAVTSYSSRLLLFCFLPGCLTPSNEISPHGLRHLPPVQHACLFSDNIPILTTSHTDKRWPYFLQPFNQKVLNFFFFLLWELCGVFPSFSSPFS